MAILKIPKAAWLWNKTSTKMCFPVLRQKIGGKLIATSSRSFSVCLIPGLMNHLVKTYVLLHNDNSIVSETLIGCANNNQKEPRSYFYKLFY